MARPFEPYNYNIGLNPLLAEINQNPELINLESQAFTPSSFMLFSNGALADAHHINSHISPNPNGMQGESGRKSKKEESGLKRRRKANDDIQNQKPRDVVHVRAKRGQATDCHSLAERVRREKINERLKCLQDHVPGCYKTMGMAVMLEVIIDYVRSLQNQIEFLSMKLSAASAYYDLNSLDLFQEGGNTYSAQDMDKILSSTLPF